MRFIQSQIHTYPADLHDYPGPSSYDPRFLFNFCSALGLVPKLTVRRAACLQDPLIT